MAPMNRLVRLLLLASLLAVAGCAGVGSLPDVGDEDRRATVTNVVDGDTVAVRYEDGGTDTVRLLGVDAPELGGGNEPGEFEGVPDTAAGRRCLEGAAHEASAFAERHLAGASVTVVVDAAADRRDRYGRLLAYVELANGTDLNRRLVQSGNARVYDSTFSRSDRYYAAEAEAREAGRGLWRCRDPEAVGRGDADAPLRVVAVHADAAGNDHENLDDEYVVFRNAGGGSLDLIGWTVRDETGHVYRFPDGLVLEPDATVTLYSGAGEDTDAALHWGADGAVWNNDGDTVVVTNASGAVVLEYRY